MADGSVPVGKYTRQAMVNAGMLDAVDDVSTITTTGCDLPGSRTEWKSTSAVT